MRTAYGEEGGMMVAVAAGSLDRPGEVVGRGGMFAGGREGGGDGR